MGVIVHVRRSVAHVSPAEAFYGALTCPHAVVALKGDQRAYSLEAGSSCCRETIAMFRINSSMHAEGKLHTTK